VIAAAIQYILGTCDSLPDSDLNVEIEAILDSVNHKEIHTIENASEKVRYPRQRRWLGE